LSIDSNLDAPLIIF